MESILLPRTSAAERAWIRRGREGKEETEEDGWWEC